MWISIHALVKRATSFHCLYYNVSLYFNPRPREEGDCAAVRRHAYHLHFNPRPREEGDTSILDADADTVNFNPRPREEGDGLMYKGLDAL